MTTNQKQGNCSNHDENCNQALTTWIDLPPRVIMMILENEEDRNTLFSHRTINQQCNDDVVSKILERISLGNFSKWVPRADSVPTFQPVVAMFVSDFRNDNGDTTPTPPSVLGHSRDIANYNPLVIKSLYLIGVPSSSNVPPVILLETAMVNWGTHLTSLSLTNLTVTPTYLVKILEATPNLKALQLETLTLIMKDNQKPEVDFAIPLPALPDLTTLLVCGNRCETNGFNFEEECFDWLHKSYTAQLINLEATILHYSSEGRLPCIKTPLSKLEQLKVQDVGEDFLLHIPAAPLKRLSVSTITVRDMEPIPLLVSFIDKFSTTLVHLCLDFCWMILPSDVNEIYYLDSARHFNLLMSTNGGNDIDPNDPLPGISGLGLLPSVPVPIPTLKILEIPFPEYKLGMLLIRNYFLPKFPQLQELNFLGFSGSKDLWDKDRKLQIDLHGIKGFWKQLGLWQICPALESIYVFGEDSEAILDVSRRPEEVNQGS